ncbi:MAG TPA: S41 family peptidase [Chitinophagaceae bacterium]|nr:S41 family peptidase [Chitinophagaceae bacterium]
MASFVLSNTVPAQSVGNNGNDSTFAACITQASKLLDETLVLMQKHYYRKDSVEWDDLITSAKIRLNSSSNCETAHEIVQWCFKQLKERHSFIMPASKAAVYNGNINSSGNPATLKQLAGPIRHELIGTDIAYIDVPWLSSADKDICTNYADSLQTLIAGFDKAGVTKWIIDLRHNTGGNCWPMLAGLGPLLGNGTYGYFISSSEKIPFSYQNGSVLQGKYKRCTVTNPFMLLSTAKHIVVLTGPNTASAGEIVALAFKGVNNVQFIGEPTAGLTTANATYKLSDGSMLVLTVCKEADRNGRIYEGRIQPDQVIAPQPGGGKDVVKAMAVMLLDLSN